MAAAMRPDASAARTPVSRGIALAGLIAALGVALALALPWLAEREITRAADTWREDVDAAQTALDRAAMLNPLSVRPAVTAGSIAVAVDDLPRAEEEFRKALEREPGNSYAEFELGLVASARGERKSAIALLQGAAQHSPRDSIIARALRRARRGRRLEPAALNRQILRRAQTRESDAP
jgi:tetratricopeptide (TPR) repeat protein